MLYTSSYASCSCESDWPAINRKVHELNLIVITDNVISKCG